MPADRPDTEQMRRLLDDAPVTRWMRDNARMEVASAEPGEVADSLRRMAAKLLEPERPRLVSVRTVEAGLHELRQGNHVISNPRVHAELQTAIGELEQ